MRRIPMINGDEYDTFTRWREVTANNHGKRPRVKRGYRRRERRQGRQETAQALHEALAWAREDYSASLEDCEPDDQDASNEAADWLDWCEFDLAWED